MQTQHPLRQWRTTHNISLVELAGWVGSTAATISRIERGLHFPRKSLLRNLCDKTGVDKEQLVTVYLGNTNDSP